MVLDFYVGNVTTCVQDLQHYGASGVTSVMTVQSAVTQEVRDRTEYSVQETC